MRKRLNDTKRRNIYTPFIFVFFILYSFLVVNRMTLPTVRGVSYVYHTVDYGMGFCSKFLPGTVYRLICGGCSENSATLFETVILLLIYAAAAVLLNKFLLFCPKDDQKTARAAVLLYISGPCAITSFSKNLGMLDTWWLLFTILFIVLLQYRYTRLLLPVFGFLSIAVHYGALLSFIPMFALLILYEAAIANEKKDKYILWTAFLLFTACSIGTFAYFGTHDAKNIRVTVDEFQAILASRGVTKSDYFKYEIFGSGSANSVQHFIDATGLFGKYSGESFAGDIAEKNGSLLHSLLFALITQIKLHLSFYFTGTTFRRVFIQLGALLFLLLPVYIVMYRIIGEKRKTEANRLLRFVYFCMFAMLPYGTLFSVFISTDSVRWTIQNFLCLFTLLLYMAYREKNCIFAVVRKVTKNLPSAFLRVYYCLYAATVFFPFV